MRVPNPFPRIGRVASSYRYDILALAVLALVALAFLSPAIKDGYAFGNYDTDLALTSLTQGVFHSVHSPFNGDAVSQMVAWNTLDWQMIHHGQFPLWNHYSALGMPQFLNFESSVLSLPDLVSYAVPLKFAFLVVVFVKFVIAGSGVYVLARVLRLRVVSALFAAVTFMFSGAFASWLTWPLSDVAAWSGWICAFAVLAYRDRHPGYIAGLAIAVAFSIYGGFPEANIMFVFLIVIIGVVIAALKAIRRERIDIRGCARVVSGGLFGGALSAPLWLPGLQVVALGHRSQEGHYAGLPLRTLPMLFSQGYFGMPVGTHIPPFQLTRWNYYETVSYVGIIALVFASVAVMRRWRQPLVVGLVVATLFSMAMTYEPVLFHPLQSLTYRVKEISTIRFERMRIFTGFLIAVLAGIGMDTVLRTWSKQAVRRAFALAATLGGLAVAYAVVTSLAATVTGSNRAERLSALRWPAIIVAALFVVGVVGLRRSDAIFGRIIVVVATIAQVVYLFFAGVGIPTYSPEVYPSTPAVAQLQQLVGSSLVGLDGGNTSNVRLFSHIGFYPNVNIGYHIRLFAIHDPLIPKAYFSSWPIQAAAPQRFGVGLFTPDVNTASIARRYGISYVLVAPGLAAPQGMVYVTTIAGERLYHVPGSEQFSVVSSSFDGRRGTVGHVTDNGNGRYSFAVDVANRERTQQLIARVTNLPGWHISIDGHPAAIHSYLDVMMSVSITPGHHRIVIWYWPKRLSDGLMLAVVAVLLFVAYAVASSLTARRHKSHARA